MPLRPCQETTTAAIRHCLTRALSTISDVAIERNVARAGTALRAARGAHLGIDLSDLDVNRILAEVITANDHGYPWHWNAGRRDKLNNVALHGPPSRESLLTAWAEAELTLQAEMHKLAGDAYRARNVAVGSAPAKDAQGNDLPETTDAETLAAWQARQTLYNDFLCHFHSTESTKTLLRSRIAAIVPHALSSDLATAKDQLLAKYDRAVRARCEYLFDGYHRPHNQQQRDARDKMLEGRQNLVRGLRGAANVHAANILAMAQISLAQAVDVEGSPTWDRDGEPLSGHPQLEHSSTYTTGSTPWSLALHAHTSANSNLKSKAAGDCLLDEWTHPEFEVANVTVSAAAGDLNFVLRRKTGAAGHPPAGSHTLALTARNRRGPTTLTVIVVVPV